MRARALLLLLPIVLGLVAMAPPAGSAPGGGSKAVGAWWDRTAMAAGKSSPSRYYSVRSDLPPDLTREYAAHLDTMYDEYSKRLVKQAGLRKNAKDYWNVYMFASQQDYLDTLRTQFGINATGSGGMFFVSARGGGLAFWVQGLPKQRVAHVIQHEGFHQFAHPFFGGEMPPWLNEGLAEFFGESVVEGKSVVIGQASPDVVKKVRDAVEHDKSIPFLDLLLMDDQRWGANVRGGSAAMQYMQSWSMVHFLVYGDGGKYEPLFSNMLKLLNAGTKPLDAWKKAFNLDSDAKVAQFEARWKEYARTMKPGAYIAARNRLEFLAEGLRDVWSHGGRPRTFEDLKAAMKDAKFQWTASSHGYVTKLDSADDANFAIPDDEVNLKPVAIELSAPKPPKGGKTKKLEDEHPTPPAIRTKGLRPNDVGVRWTRSADDPAEFTYEITVGG